MSEIMNKVFMAVIFFAAIFNGAYFIGTLIVLNIFFLTAIFLQKRAVDLTALLFIALLGVMSVSVVLFSLSLYNGLTELLKYALFGLAYIYFLDSPENDTFYKVFIFIMIFGLLGMIGISPWPGMISPYTGRMQSFIGYANTLALLMGIGAFYTTFKFIETKSKLLILPFVGFIAALIFTGSRVGFVTFIAVYLLYIFRMVSLKIKLAAAGGLFVITAVLMLLDNRIVNISIFAPTLVERYISYYDAGRIMLMRPFGLGTANWVYMQYYYQSAPYAVRFIHNFYLQVGLDGGFLALGLLLVILVIALYHSKKNLHFYIALFILSGAFFEVHFNFGLVIVYFAYVLVRIKPETGWRFVFPQKIRYAALLPILPMAVLLLANFHYNTGVRYENIGETQSAHASFAASKRLNPINASALHFALARTASDFETYMYNLHRALELNPWDTNVIFALASGYYQSGDIETAYYYADILLTKFPFSTRNQALAFDIARALGAVNELETRIADINSGINRLYRFIDPYFRY